jgi:hypothetical protein
MQHSLPSRLSRRLLIRHWPRPVTEIVASRTTFSSTILGGWEYSAVAPKHLPHVIQLLIDSLKKYTASPPTRRQQQQTVLKETISLHWKDDYETRVDESSDKDATTMQDDPKAAPSSTTTMEVPLEDAIQGNQTDSDSVETGFPKS